MTTPTPTTTTRPAARTRLVARATIAVLTLTIAAGAACQQAPAPPPAGALVDGTVFANLPVWNDGYAEMAYYDAVDTIYGKQRDYTRVHLLNRQHMNATSGVKDPTGGPDAVAVFKFSIAEQIPTENYNYRLFGTAFIACDTMRPFKLAVSSQEWCGTTYKTLRWRDDQLEVASFSYFPDEGDKTWTREVASVPAESLFVVARAAVAAGLAEPVAFSVLPEMRGTHEVIPDAMSATLSVDATAVGVQTPGGSFTIRRVTVERGDDRSAYTYDISTTAPHELVAFVVGDVSGSLRFVERRPYWDGASQSAFYKQNAAP